MTKIRRRATVQWMLLVLSTVVLAIGTFASPGSAQTDDDPIYCPWSEYASCAWNPETGFMYRHLEELE